jgi:hypothetical protein
MNENSWNSRWSKEQIKTMLLGQFDAFWGRIQVLNARNWQKLNVPPKYPMR